jgi:YebC/PmpR family DNA-binding regulatory protein
MAGHNKWSKVKNFKGKIDAARARAFSRCAKEITVSAKIGGGDPNFNPRLRTAIMIAKAENMPNDNIERSIKKGTGELESANYEEFTYEGYGPGGVAVIVEALTDNKNRAAADIRRVFSSNGGNLASQGAVSFMFQRRGLVIVQKSQISEDDLLSVVLDAGAEDMKTDDENYEIITPIDSFDKVVDAIKKKKIEPSSAKFSYIPQSTTAVTDEVVAKKVLALMEELDSLDDVQHVHSNFDIPDAILEKV